jgi:hypothetical protein
MARSNRWEKSFFVYFHVAPPLTTSSSSSELLAEKSGLGGKEMEDRRESGRGSSSSFVSSDA